ncbi:MAG: hypothetical protein BMS9Abin20_0041 [Acidimicrobiia bacterium]|nr:MAG: hypothetical protein BMS9Abin20_0041 [Acidimicrobiia bacterium]
MKVARRMEMIEMHSRGRTYIDPRSDGLASVGIRAVLRIKALGSLGEGNKLFPRTVKVLNVLIEILEVPIEELDDVVTSALSIAAEIENGGDLHQGQPGRLSIANESQPLRSLIPVFAVPVRSPVGLREKSDVLVVADRLGRDTCPSAEFADFHDRKYTRIFMTEVYPKRRLTF